jgi:ribonuclease VapC
MVIDTSAIVAILLLEPDRGYYFSKILKADHRQVSAVSYVEAGMVLSGRLGQDPKAALDEMLIEMDIEIVPVSTAQAVLALEAFQKYGKGRHPAGLNFGDCFSYALAKSSSEPLLFKGGDFAHTDITSA